MSRMLIVRLVLSSSSISLSLLVVVSLGTIGSIVSWSERDAARFTRCRRLFSEGSILILISWTLMGGCVAVLSKRETESLID